MEKIEVLRWKVKMMENFIEKGSGDYTEWDIYRFKKEMFEFKYLNPNNTEIDSLISMMESLETAYDKKQSDKMNHKLNLLTVWSTIFLPLSFYTGMWGMNFDDVPLLTGDDGFWIFVALSVVTIVVMFSYFKRNKWF
jgi:magnesium transporter